MTTYKINQPRNLPLLIQFTDGNNFNKRHMKKCILILTLLIVSTMLYGQESKSGIVITTYKTVDDSDIRRLLRFEGIQFQKMSFNGAELVNKSYRLTVKEIWDGEIKSESDV